MENQEAALRIIRDLVTTQQFAVLATQDQGQPYVSLMAFAATDDLRNLVFITERATHKFANMLANTRTAVMIDNRSNRAADTETATAVSALGRAGEVEGEERDRHLAAYIHKYPHLAEFARSPSCAVVCIRVESYYVVTHFQEVYELQFQDG